jgi:GNAT superfamily N-acetyltransferase
MNPEVTFRRANPSDALCIGVLGMQVFLNTYATAGIRPSIAREVLQSLSPNVVEQALTDPDKTFVLMETDAHLIGFAEITTRASPAIVSLTEAAELNRLYVQEPFTGQGFGRALLVEAEATALAGGALALWLTAWTGNARAVAFYARQGYERLGSTLFIFEGEQHENHVFAKVLRESGFTG